MKTDNQCTRCGEGRMQRWHELNDEEREVVRRLPAAADYSPEERQNSHLWCPRCWYEAVSSARQT